MNVPIQKSDGQWYFFVANHEFGPFLDEADAWQGLEDFYRAKPCPNGSCEE